MAWLNITTPDGHSRRVLLSTGRTTIGRSSENTVPVDHPTLSRTHAALEPEGGGWTVTDLGSRNGIRVGKEPVKKAALKAGMRFSLGKVGFEITEEQSSPATEVPAPAPPRREVAPAPAPAAPRPSPPPGAALEMSAPAPARAPVHPEPVAEPFSIPANPGGRSGLVFLLAALVGLTLAAVAIILLLRGKEKSGRSNLGRPAVREVASEPAIRRENLSHEEQHPAQQQVPERPPRLVPVHDDEDQPHQRNDQVPQPPDDALPERLDQKPESAEKGDQKARE